MNKEAMNNLENQLVSMEEARLNTVPSDIERLAQTGAPQFYCSIPDTGDRSSKVKIYNAINNAAHKIDDVKGQKINVVDIIAHPVSLVADETGEVMNATRIVLVDDKGVGYETVASGVMSSLEKIFGIVGMPSYDPPLGVVPREQKTRKGYKTLTLDLVL